MPNSLTHIGERSNIFRIWNTKYNSKIYNSNSIPIQVPSVPTQPQFWLLSTKVSKMVHYNISIDDTR